MTISITTCNLALGELRAAPIVDNAEDSIEARECTRYYPQCLRILLERHDWAFANRRATLAELATNDRAAEWGHAYVLPVDCATPLRLVAADGCAPDFIVENRTLYTSLGDAVLEYATSDVTDSEMTGLFVDALAYALAARLAVPLRDSREIKGQRRQRHVPRYAEPDLVIDQPPRQRGRPGAADPVPVLDRAVLCARDGAGLYAPGCQWRAGDRGSADDHRPDAGCHHHGRGRLPRL